MPGCSPTRRQAQRARSQPPALGRRAPQTCWAAPPEGVGLGACRQVQETAFQFAIYKAGPRLGTGQGLAHRHTAGQRQAGPEPSPAGLELAEGPPNDSVLVNWPTLQGKNVRVSVQAQGTCLVWPRGGDLEQMSGGS